MYYTTNYVNYQVFFIIYTIFLLIVTLNENPLPYTVVRRATGTSQIVGTCIINTTSINSILTILNHSGNATALTITPNAGRTESVSVHLIIKKLA